MKHLILHIGHGKTGSSYIQSILACNTKKLEQLNVYYPNHSSFNAAKNGHISSGNGSVLLDNEEIDFGKYKNILFSGETLFYQLLQNDNLEKKILGCCDKVSVILYTRNVLDLLSSTWGQAVKKKHFSKPINDFLVTVQDSHHTNVLEWINLSKKHKFKLHIKNYSNHTNDIFRSFSSVLCKALEVDEGVLDDFIVPTQKIVNRSMSFAEYVLIQSSNRLDPKFGSVLSDALTNSLPNIISELPSITDEVKITLTKKYEPIISELNNHLEKTEFLEFENKRVSKAKKEVNEISEAQLELYEKTFKIYFTSNNSLIKIIKNNIINLVRAIRQKISK